jgi:hypothetical protein
MAFPNEFFCICLDEEEGRLSLCNLAPLPWFKLLKEKKRLSQFSWDEEKLGPHCLEDLGYISMKKLSKEISGL